MTGKRRQGVLPATGRAALLAALFLLCPIPVQAGQTPLPDIGETAQSYLSTAEEQRLGAAFMHKLRHSLKIIADPEVNTYIQALGYRLVANSDFRGREFTFFVVDSQVINAFAGPGGHIGINSGLILITHSEAELASVIAHEIAHVTQRHIARAVEEASKMNLPMTAALIAALILGSQDAQMGTAALAATTAGSVQHQINFTRSNEMEADRIGIRILAESGFNPRSMPLFFARMQRASGTTENPQFEFLRTHPVTTARIADTLNRAAQYPRIKNMPSLNYALIKAKLRVIQQDDAQQSASYFAARLKDKAATEEPAMHYGYGLALLAANNYTAARQQAQLLIARDPDKPAYQILLAKIEQAAGQPDKALKIYRKSLELYPYHQALSLLYARTLIQSGHPDRARILLVDYQRARKQKNPLFYSLLAQAEDDSGRVVAAHQALAEYYYLTGETGTAIEQLKIAMKTARTKNTFQQEKIAARLKQLQRLFLQEKEDKK